MFSTALFVNALCVMNTRIDHGVAAVSTRATAPRCRKQLQQQSFQSLPRRHQAMMTTLETGFLARLVSII